MLGEALRLLLFTPRRWRRNHKGNRFAGRRKNAVYSEWAWTYVRHWTWKLFVLTWVEFSCNGSSIATKRFTSSILLMSQTSRGTRCVLIISALETLNHQLRCCLHNVRNNRKQVNKNVFKRNEWHISCSCQSPRWILMWEIPRRNHTVISFWELPM